MSLAHTAVSPIWCTCHYHANLKRTSPSCLGAHVAPILTSSTYHHCVVLVQTWPQWWEFSTWSLRWPGTGIINIGDVSITITLVGFKSNIIYTLKVYCKHLHHAGLIHSLSTCWPGAIKTAMLTSWKHNHQGDLTGLVASVAHGFDLALQYYSISHSSTYTWCNCWWSQNPSSIITGDCNTDVEAPPKHSPARLFSLDVTGTYSRRIIFLYSIMHNQLWILLIHDLCKL